jgi:hypothetical protein
MNNSMKNGEIRKSAMLLNEMYFWTSTITNWQHLLQPDAHKDIIINSLQWLVQKEMIKVYGYVIMPNHIHLLWEGAFQIVASLIEPRGWPKQPCAAPSDVSAVGRPSDGEGWPSD